MSAHILTVLLVLTQYFTAVSTRISTSDTTFHQTYMIFSDQSKESSFVPGPWSVTHAQDPFLTEVEMAWPLLTDDLIQVWRLLVLGVGHLTVSEPQARGCGQDVATRSSAIRFLTVHPAYKITKKYQTIGVMSKTHLLCVANITFLRLTSKTLSKSQERCMYAHTYMQHRSCREVADNVVWAS